MVINEPSVFRRKRGITMLHVVIVLTVLLAITGSFLSIRAVVLRKNEIKRSRREAQEAFDSLLSRDTSPYRHERPNGFVILSGTHAYTNLNGEIKELSFVGKNVLTDTSYRYFTFADSLYPDSEPVKILYFFDPGQYDVYRLRVSEEEYLYLWVDPDTVPLSRYQGASLYTALNVLSVPEKIEYDYNVTADGGAPENALCRLTDPCGGPLDDVLVTVTPDSITLGVKNPDERITHIEFNDHAVFPLDTPATTVTVPISFLLSVPSTPVYPNDLMVTVKSKNDAFFPFVQNP